MICINPPIGIRQRRLGSVVSVYNMSSVSGYDMSAVSWYEMSVVSRVVL